MRFFAGVSLQDAADMLGVSAATAKRYWAYARSWLYGKLRGEGYDFPATRFPEIFSSRLSRLISRLRIVEGETRNRGFSS